MKAEAVKRLGHPVPEPLGDGYVGRLWSEIRYDQKIDPRFWEAWRLVCYDDVCLCAEIYSELIAHASRGRITALGVYVRRVRDKDCYGVYLTWDDEMGMVTPDHSVRWRNEPSPSRVRAEVMVRNQRPVPFRFRDTPCKVDPIHVDIERNWGKRGSRPPTGGATFRWDLYE